MLQVKLEPPTKYNSIPIKLGNGRFAIVSQNLPVDFFEYVWCAVKWNYRWYAYSWKKKNGATSRVAMHRLIANTPPGEVCHHLNKNTLDNRDGNLLNQIPRHHMELHGIRKFGRKKDHKTTIANKGQSNQEAPATY